MKSKLNGMKLSCVWLYNQRTLNWTISISIGITYHSSNTLNIFFSDEYWHRKEIDGKIGAYFSPHSQSINDQWKQVKNHKTYGSVLSVWIKRLSLPQPDTVKYRNDLTFNEKEEKSWRRRRRMVKKNMVILLLLLWYWLAGINEFKHQRGYFRYREGKNM